VIIAEEDSLAGMPPGGYLGSWIENTTRGTGRG